MKKKVNPRRIPRTEADLNKAIWFTVKHMKALCIQAALDEGLIQPDDVSRLWDRVTRLTSECDEGRIKMTEIYDVLKEEYGLEEV